MFTVGLCHIVCVRSVHIIPYAGVNNISILIPKNADLKGAAARQQKKEMSDIISGSNTTSTGE